MRLVQTSDYFLAVYGCGDLWTVEQCEGTVMALKGTLRDISAVDLIQYPHTGHKTGELVIAKNGSEAKLYYNQGNLVHAAMGAATGMDVLVDLVDWQLGDFEFRQDVSTQQSTIRMDLHRALMQALKQRDEKKLQSRTPAKTAAQQDNRQALGNYFSKFIKETDGMQYACCLDPKGRVFVEARGGQTATDTLYSQKLVKLLLELSRVYPREGLRRVLLEDKLGTLVLLSTKTGHTLILMAQPQLSMGAVSISANNLAAAVVSHTQ